jgi:hypothetical protein
MVQRKDKKLVYVPHDLLEEVAKASRGRGITMSRFIEEALVSAVRVTTAGYDLQQLGEFFEVMYAQRVLGGAFVPMDVLNHLTSEVCKQGKEHLNNVWFQSGRWHGKYLKDRFDDPVAALKSFLEASRWDLSEVEVKNEGYRVKIRCVSTVLKEDATEALSKFVEGIMQGIGYKIGKSELLKGMVILEFKP